MRAHSQQYLGPIVNTNAEIVYAPCFGFNLYFTITFELMLNMSASLCFSSPPPPPHPPFLGTFSRGHLHQYSSKKGEGVSPMVKREKSIVPLNGRHGSTLFPKRRNISCCQMDRSSNIECLVELSKMRALDCF